MKIIIIISSHFQLNLLFINFQVNKLITDIIKIIYLFIFLNKLFQTLFFVVVVVVSRKWQFAVLDIIYDNDDDDPF